LDSRETQQDKNLHADFNRLYFVATLFNKLFGEHRGSLETSWEQHKSESNNKYFDAPWL